MNKAQKGLNSLERSPLSTDKRIKDYNKIQKVLVDTCVWSRVLRHALPDEELSIQLKGLIDHALVVMIGPIRQELLSGISQPRQFQILKDKLAAFDDLPLKTGYFEKAAEFCNLCRRQGIQGSTIDFLICAIAASEDMAVFTVDKDFGHYKKHLPFTLFHQMQSGE